MSREELRAKVKEIVVRCAEIQGDLGPAESFHRHGIDSLAGVNIAYEIGLLIGRDVPPELVTEHDTIDKLVDYVLA